MSSEAGEEYFEGIVQYAAVLGVMNLRGVENDAETWTTVKRRALSLATFADELAQFAEDRIKVLEEVEQN